jgi:DNA-binding transcriptional LysR family regulator
MLTLVDRGLHREQIGFEILLGRKASTKDGVKLQVSKVEAGNLPSGARKSTFEGGGKSKIKRFGVGMAYQKYGSNTHEPKLAHRAMQENAKSCTCGMQKRMTDSAAGRVFERWDDIPFLLAVLRSGSFSGAATLLGTDQSTVSRRIAALEETLGVTLFERGARSPTPTPIALALRAAAERVEVEVGRFADAVAEENQAPLTGRVRVALTEEMAVHFVIPHVIPSLRAEHPELHVDLLTSYRTADLMAHEADIALRFFRSSRGDLVGKKVGEMKTAILCAKTQLRSFRKRPLEELPWTIVELEAGGALESEFVNTWLRRPAAMKCTSYQVQLAAVRAGLGVGIGPAVISRLDSDLAILPSAELKLPVLELFVFTRRAIRNVPPVAAVFSALEEKMTSLFGR